MTKAPTKSDDFHETIVRRLRAKASSPSQLAMALAVLQQIRWYSVGESLELCTKTGSEIGSELGLKSSNLPEILSLLEDVGAINRTKEGKEKIISLSKEYANAELNLPKFRETILPFFSNSFNLGIKVGITNIKGVWKDIRKLLYS